MDIPDQELSALGANTEALRWPAREEAGGGESPRSGRYSEVDQANDLASSLLDLRMRNGNRLQFFTDEVDGLKTLLVVEQGTTTESALDDPRFGSRRSRDPLDILWAFTPKGAPIPQVVTDFFPVLEGDGSVDRGWATDLVAPPQSGATVSRYLGIGPSDEDACTDPADESLLAGAEERSADLGCDDEWFTSPDRWGGLISQNPFISLNRTPASYSGFKRGEGWGPGNGQSWGHPRYECLLRLVTKESRVRVCGRSVQNQANDHWIYYSTWSDESGWIPQDPIYIGPRIQCVYYWGGWRVMKTATGKLASYELLPNQQGWTAMRFYTSEPTAHGVRVHLAKPLDEFDFLIDRPGGY